MQWLFGDSLIGAIVDDFLYLTLIATLFVSTVFAIDWLFYQMTNFKITSKIHRFFYDDSGKLAPGFKWRFMGVVVGIPLVITVTEHYNELRELFFGP